MNYPGSSFSGTFQDLKLSFPGLSRTKLIFQGLENRGKIQDFPRCVGTLYSPTYSYYTMHVSSNISNTT